MRLLTNTMKSTAASLCLCLLLHQPPFCLTDTDQDFSNTHRSAHRTENTSSVFSTAFNRTTNDRAGSFDEGDNGTGLDCFINTEMGLVAIGTAGGLIACLLVTVAVLAWQVYRSQRLVYIPRTSRSNMCLVGAAGNWGPVPPEAVGLIGPCDMSAVLEEVTTESQLENKKEPDIQEEEEEEEAGAGLEDGAPAVALDPEGRASHLRSSITKDSYQEVPRDLQDMPLVV